MVVVTRRTLFWSFYLSVQLLSWISGKKMPFKKTWTYHARYKLGTLFWLPDIFESVHWRWNKTHWIAALKYFPGKATMETGINLLSLLSFFLSFFFFVPWWQNLCLMVPSLCWTQKFAKLCSLDRPDGGENNKKPILHTSTYSLSGLIFPRWLYRSQDPGSGVGIRPSHLWRGCSLPE